MPGIRDRGPRYKHRIRREGWVNRGTGVPVRTPIEIVCGLLGGASLAAAFYLCAPPAMPGVGDVPNTSMLVQVKARVSVTVPVGGRGALTPLHDTPYGYYEIL